jgi:hypothetical protein
MPDSLHSVPAADAASSGMRRQFEIYQLGLAGKKISVPIPLAELERKAAEVLSPQPPRIGFNFIGEKITNSPAACSSGQRSPDILCWL